MKQTCMHTFLTVTGTQAAR